MVNARGHATPTGAATSVSRGTIFDTFGNSIRDVVPVANTTARATLVSTLTTAGQGPSSTKPLFVYRHDAPGLHRLEYTIDGTVWLPGSGMLRFADVSARDTWTTSNSGYLSTWDQCVAGAVLYTWNGSAWFGTGTFTPSFTGLTLGSGGTATGTLDVIGNEAFVTVSITLGTSMSVGDVTLLYPSGGSAAAQPDLMPVGEVVYVDTSAGAAGRYRGQVYKATGGFRFLRDAGSSNIQPLSSTGPFTWASSDQMYVNLRYPIG